MGYQHLCCFLFNCIVGVFGYNNIKFFFRQKPIILESDRLLPIYTCKIGLLSTLKTLKVNRNNFILPPPPNFWVYFAHKLCIDCKQNKLRNNSEQYINYHLKKNKMPLLKPISKSYNYPRFDVRCEIVIRRNNAISFSNSQNKRCIS